MLKRFQNEVRAAAQLSHPHIVDVYGVGYERSVRFNAMRYVEGESLATVIQQLRSFRQNERLGRQPSISAMSSSETDQHATLIRDVDQDTQLPPPPTTDLLPSRDTRPIAAVTTDHSVDSRELFQSVAQLGIQVSVRN